MWKVTDVDGMKDMHEKVSLLRGRTPEKTTKARRIDFVWTNKQADLVVGDCWSTEIYPTHSTLPVELSVSSFTQTKTERVLQILFGRSPTLTAKYS